MMRLMAVCVLAQAVPLASAAGDGGAFGDWGADAFGLPTYNYTLDHLPHASWRGILNYTRGILNTTKPSGAFGGTFSP